MNNEEKILSMLTVMQGDISEIKTKVGGLETKVGGLETKVGGLETKVGGLEAKVDGLEAKVDGLETKMDGLEAKVDNLEKEMRQGFHGIGEAIFEVVEVVGAKTARLEFLINSQRRVNERNTYEIQELKAKAL